MGKTIRHIWVFSLIWLVLLAITLLTMPNEGQCVKLEYRSLPEEEATLVASRKVGAIITFAGIILSLAVGLLMGIIGGGGGGIYVVIIMIFLHQDVRTAVGTALVLSTITLSGAAWQYWRKKQVRMDYFAVMSVLGIVGTFAGSLFMKYINENILKIAIICVFVLSGLSSLLKVKFRKGSTEPMEELPKAAKKLPVLVPLGLGSGLITGAMGLSGGTVLSSFLIGLPDFSPYLAVGTTTLTTMVLNLSGAVFHIASTHIDLETLLTLGIGSAIGSIFGAKIATKINRKVLAFGLAIMAILSGIYLAVK